MAAKMTPILPETVLATGKVETKTNQQAIIFIIHDEKENTMKKRNTLRITLILSLLMGLFTTGMAFASEGNELEVEGTIIALYPEEFYLEVEAEVESEIVVLEIEVGQNFNFDAYDVGDLLELKGTLNEDGRLVVTELKIQERARDRVMTQDGELESYYCDVEDKDHPIAAKLEESYGLDEGTIKDLLCGEEKAPLGKIMLALQTIKIVEDTELSEKYDLEGLLDKDGPVKWGKIWQEIGLKGKPDHGIAPGQIKKQDGDKDPAGEGNDQGSNKGGKP
jgi:hypothetical protein